MVVVSAVTPAGAVWVIASVLLQNQGSGAFWSMVLAAVIGIGMCLLLGRTRREVPDRRRRLFDHRSCHGKAPGLSHVHHFPDAGDLYPERNRSWRGTVRSGGVAECGCQCRRNDSHHRGNSARAIMHIRFNAVVTGFFLFIELAAIIIACVLGFFFAKSGLNWSELIHPHVFSASGEATAAKFCGDRSRHWCRTIFVQWLSLGAVPLRGDPSRWNAYQAR